MQEPLRSELILALHPTVRNKMAAGLLACQKQGLNVCLFEGYRSDERQAWLYAKGRTTPGSIVTNAKPGDSWHRYACAGDLVFKDAKGNWTWEGDYEAVGKTMTAAGFYWGKHFAHFPELDHFEMNFGLSLEDAKTIYLKGGNVEVWKKLDQLVGKQS